MNQQPWCIGPQPFDVKEESCATEWKKWLRSFELFATASGIKDESKHNWLLHYAGPKVQDIFDNIPDLPRETNSKESGRIGFEVESDGDEYNETVIKLTNHFAPKQNKSYERHMFRKMSQGKNERIDSFAIRLREQADRCEFGNQKDENIKDQITAACHSDLLRRKILERGDQNLDSIMKLARILESVSNQQNSFVNDAKSSADGLDDKNEVCEIGTRTAFKRKYFNQAKSNHKRDRMECGRCGWNGHKSGDDECPAKGKKCLKCGKIDHFSRKCFSRNSRESSTGFKREPVRMVDTYDDYDDVFIIDNDNQTNEQTSYYDDEINDNSMRCKIGGVELKLVVDSGTKRNIIDRETWTDLKAKHIVTTWHREEVDVDFASYGGHRLQFLGMFEANVQIGDKQSMETFYVADEIGKCLLGHVTAKHLDILKIGIDINKVKGTLNAGDDIIGSLVAAPSTPEPLSRRSLPSAAWEHLLIDYMGPLQSKDYLLIVVDYYSRYKEVEIVTSTDANQTIRKLKMMFARFGLPLSLQADNGPPFNSNEFGLFCKDINIHLNNGIPYWPQQNCEVERQNGLLLKRLKISQLENRNWQDDLQDYLLTYRSTKHSTTMMTPAEMMFSRNIRDKSIRDNKAEEVRETPKRFGFE